MNKYQKIVLIIGAISLFLIFGKTITRISFGAFALLGKATIIIVATVLIILALNKSVKKK